MTVRLPARKKDAFGVDVHGPVPVRLRGLEKRAYINNAGIIEQRVNASEVIHGAPYESGAVLGGGYIDDFFNALRSGVGRNLPCDGQLAFK